MIVCVASACVFPIKWYQEPWFVYTPEIRSAEINRRDVKIAVALASQRVSQRRQQCPKVRVSQRRQQHPKARVLQGLQQRPKA